MRVFILALIASSGVAVAEERFDHSGSLGLTVASGGEVLTAVSNKATGERGARIPIEIGGTLALTSKTELRISARLAPGITPVSGWAASFYGGIRNSVGFEQWKTFFDLELAVHAVPFFAIGARAAFGVQYDFHPVVGVYAQIGGQLGGATSLRLSGELMAGFQFRTYVFE